MGSVRATARQVALARRGSVRAKAGHARRRETIRIEQAAVIPRRDADDARRDAVVALKGRALFRQQRNEPARDVSESDENQIKLQWR